MAEKLAPVITVALVGAAATGASPVTASPPAGEQMTRDTKVTSLLGLQPTAPPAEAKKAPPRKKRVPAAQPEPAPPAPEPAPAPAPEPTTEPQPSPTEAPPSEGTPSGHEPGDTPPPVPQPFNVSVGFDRGTGIPKVLPIAHTASVSCATFSVRQHLETVIHDGSDAYPATIDLLADARDVSVYITIHKGEYEVSYQGPAYTSDYERTGNNLHVTYAGTYGTHPDAAKAGLPHSSTLWVDMRLDCASSSVIDEALVFGVSSSQQ
jgi:hypothetical protein